MVEKFINRSVFLKFTMIGFNKQKKEAQIKKEHSDFIQSVKDLGYSVEARIENSGVFDISGQKEIFSETPVYHVKLTLGKELNYTPTVSQTLQGWEMDNLGLDLVMLKNVDKNFKSTDVIYPVALRNDLSKEIGAGPFIGSRINTFNKMYDSTPDIMTFGKQFDNNYLLVDIVNKTK